MVSDPDFGGSSIDSFATWDHESCSWRTSKPSDPEDSETYSDRWPDSGSMRSGRACRRPTWAQPTVGVGSSFWPTATAASYGSSQNGSNASRPSGGTPSLHTLASMWPTPVTTDAKDAARGTTSTGVMHPGTTLTDAIRAWCSRHRQTMGEHGSSGSGPAVLHPEFVEALMGLPLGWTHVDDAGASDALAMGLCPGRQGQLFSI